MSLTTTATATYGSMEEGRPVVTWPTLTFELSQRRPEPRNTTAETVATVAGSILLAVGLVFLEIKSPGFLGNLGNLLGSF